MADILTRLREKKLVSDDYQTPTAKKAEQDRFRQAIRDSITGYSTSKRNAQRLEETRNRLHKEMTGITYDQAALLSKERSEALDNTLARGELTPSQQEFYSRLGTGGKSNLPTFRTGDETADQKATEEIYFNEHLKSFGADAANAPIHVNEIPAVTDDNVAELEAKLRDEFAVADAKKRQVMSRDFMDDSALMATFEDVNNLKNLATAIEDYHSKSGTAAQADTVTSAQLQAVMDELNETMTSAPTNATAYYAKKEAESKIAWAEDVIANRYTESPTLGTQALQTRDEGALEEQHEMWNEALIVRDLFKPVYEMSQTPNLASVLNDSMTRLDAARIAGMKEGAAYDENTSKDTLEQNDYYVYMNFARLLGITDTGYMKKIKNVVFSQAEDGSLSVSLTVDNGSRTANKTLTGDTATNFATFVWTWDHYGLNRARSLSNTFVKVQGGDDFLDAVDAHYDAEYATKHPVLASLYSVFTNTIVSTVASIPNIYNLIANGKINEDSALNRVITTGNTYRSTVSQNIEETHGGAWSFVYDTGMSGADLAVNLLTGYATGSIATALGASAKAASVISNVTTRLAQSSQVANQTIMDAQARGADAETTLLLAACAAGAEYITEKIPLDKLQKTLKNSRAMGLKQIAAAIGVQFGTEAVQEGGTEVLNLIADYVLMADLSNHALRVDELITKGYSREEAESKALSEELWQVGEAALSGGLLGSASTGVAVVGGKLKYVVSGDSKWYKAVYGDSAQQLVEEGLSMDNDTEAYKIARQNRRKLDKNKPLSSTRLYAQVEANDQAMQQRDISKIRAAVESRLGELGEPVAVPEVAETIAKKVAGEPLTIRERMTLRKSRYGQRVLNELDPDNVRAGKESSAWAANIGTDRIDPDVYGSAADETVVGDPAAYDKRGNAVTTPVSRSSVGANSPVADGRGIGAVSSQPAVNANVEAPRVTDVDQVRYATVPELKRLQKTYQNRISQHWTKLTGRTYYLYAGDARAEDGVTDGTDIYINAAKNGGDIDFTIAMHELMHTLQGTKEYDELLSYIMNHSEAFRLFIEEQGFETADQYFAAIVEAQRKADPTFNATRAKFEAVADFIPTIVKSETELTKLAKQKPNVFVKLWRWVRNIVQKAYLKRLDGHPTPDSDTKRINLLFQRAYSAAFRTQKKPTTTSGVQYHAPGSSESISIKDQIRTHLDELNAMEPVDAISYETTTKETMRNRVISEFQRLGGKIDRKNFGIIEIGAQEVKTASNYVETQAEIAAWSTVPRVLKRGILIHTTENHKDRGHPTFTIAAPVTINGTRGIVAVIVKKTGRNRYKSHRIVMPDGSAFTFEHNKNAESTGSDMLAKDSDQGPDINSASDYSIPDSPEKSNPKYSVPIKSPKNLTALERENTALRELVALQKQVTHGTVFDHKSVDAAAKSLMQSIVAVGDRAELASLLTDFYRYIAKDSELSWDGVRQAAQPAIDWLIDHRKQSTQLSAESRAILADLRSTSVRLDNTQKEEAAAYYGDYNTFHRKMMGTLVTSDNARVTLEERWQELSDSYPEYFDADVNFADMPMALVDAVERIRNDNSYSEEFEYNEALIREELFNSIYDSYWNVSTVKTVADEYEQQLEDLRAKHHAAMTAQRQRTAKIQSEEQNKRRRQVERVRSQAHDREEKMRERFRQSREWATENRRKTELRGKIKRTVSELDKLLRNGTKERHVMLGLQQAVASALNAINMDTIGAEERVRQKNRLIDQADDHETIQQLIGERDRIIQMDQKLKSKLETLSAAYSKIAKTPEKGGEYLKATAGMIRDKIDNVTDFVGETSIRNMSLAQLSAVYDMYTMVLYHVRDSNKLHHENRTELLEVFSKRTIDQVLQHNKESERGYKTRDDSISRVKQFSWNNLRPIVAFRRLGSEMMMSLFNNFCKAEDMVAVDIAAAKEFAHKTREKYNYDSWDMNRVTEFETPDGFKFPLSLQHMMSIYAYSRRHQAIGHMKIGGFQFDESETIQGKVYDERDPDGKPIDNHIRKKKLSSLHPFRVDEALMQRISKTLTQEQKAYVEDMQAYLSDVMGEKGNEVSRKLWGIDLFKEKYYFPLVSSKDFQTEQTRPTNEFSLINSGMTRKTEPGAGNAIVLSEFDRVWDKHVRKMSTYHAFAVPLNDFSRVYHYAAYPADKEPVSVKTVIKDTFGAEANAYIEKLIQDLNGGVMTDEISKLGAKQIANFKKTAVAASFSTIIQQPTAIVRAMAMISPKYFVGLPKIQSYKSRWVEVKKYAPVAILKEIGGFDAAGGGQLEDYLNQKQYKKFEKIKGFFKDNPYRDEVFMRGASKADEIGWVTIWEAVKREIKSTTSLDPKSEEFFKKCGERFSDVIRQTQVYDSTLSRSALMRSDSQYVKTITAFMGEPTTSIGMMYDAVLRAKRGETTKRQAARVIAATYASQIFAIAASSLVYALRDEDDEKGYWEKWWKQFKGSVLPDTVLSDDNVASTVLSVFTSDLMPHTMIPVLNDLSQILAGWEVERMDLLNFQAIVDAVQAIDNDDIGVYQKIEKLGGAVASAFGLPIRNVMRSGREIYNVYEYLTGKEDKVIALIDDLAKEIPLPKNGDLREFLDFDGVSENWKTPNGTTMTADDVDRAENALRDATFSAIEDLIDSGVWGTWDGDSKAKAVSDVRNDMWAMFRETIQSEPTQDALEVFEAYVSDLAEIDVDVDLPKSGVDIGVEFDNYIIDVYTTRLHSGAYLITDKYLSTRYLSALQEEYDHLFDQASKKRVYEFSKDNVKYSIDIENATEVELTLVRENILAKAKRHITDLFEKSDVAELTEALRENDGHQAYKRLKKKFAK